MSERDDFDTTEEFREATEEPKSSYVPDPIHLIKHTHEWPRAYGRMDKGCPACDARAERTIASGCTQYPYSLTCGSEFGSGSCGKCGRHASTS